MRLDSLFNAIYLAAAMTVGVAVGMLVVAPWPPGIPPDQTITVTAAVIAALGTWAVGIGAMHYANESHQLRLQEIEKAKRADFVRIRREIISCRMALAVFDLMSKEQAQEPFAIESSHTYHRSIISLIPSQPISNIPGMTDTETAKSHALDVSIAMLRVGIEQFLEKYKAGSLDDIATAEENFDHIIKQLRSLGGQAMRFGKELDTNRGIKDTDDESGADDKSKRAEYPEPVRKP